MTILKNLRTSTKIISVIMLLAIFLGVVGFTGYYFNTKVNNNISELYNANLLAIQSLEEAMVQIRIVQGDSYQLLLTPSDVAKDQALRQDITEYTQRFSGNITNYQNSGLVTYETEQMNVVKQEFGSYKTESQKAFDLAEGGNKLGAYNYYLQQVKPHEKNLNNAINNLITFNKQEAVQTVNNSSLDHKYATLAIIVVSLAAVVIALVLGWLVSRLIAKPLELVVANIKQIAEGNLAVGDIEYNSRDEVGILAQALNSMANNLRGLITKVSESAEQVAASSEELSASSEQHAQATGQVASSISEVAVGVEKQTLSVDETSAAMEQVSSSIKEIAVNSNEVADLAFRASTAGESGQKAVSKAVDQMGYVGKGTAEVQAAIDKLADGSKQIGEIINVISDIAGQTNLLALNAAIEAARAGEQGRGFAVVAEEVRKLAEQSQQAAEQITQLISRNQADIQKAVLSMDAGAADVKTGVEVVNDAGKAFAEISGLISRVSSRVQEISASIQQIAGGGQQVVTSIRQIENISKAVSGQAQTVSAATEEQSASVEQIASASQNLAMLAQELQNAVSIFKL